MHVTAPYEQTHSAIIPSGMYYYYYYYYYYLRTRNGQSWLWIGNNYGLL